MNPIRVAIFDDNKRVCEAIEMLITTSEGFELCGAYNSCERLIENIKTSKPDVVLMDIDMPCINGIEAVKIIRKNFPGIHVLMQTVFEDDKNIFDAIRFGAEGYILKNTFPLDILESIRQVNSGGAPITPSVAKKVLALFQKHVPTNAPEDYRLSPREKEVLELLVNGKSYKMIASALNINYETVRKHMQHIYEKLHVSSMTEAVVKAINEKIIK